jgi:P-type Ca2+ transporter type 2C
LEARIRVYGPNSFPPPKIKSLFELVMENFDDPINVILLGAAVVSVCIGLLKEGFPEGLIEGTSIMIALFLIIVVNSGNNWISERRLANLVKLSDAQEVAVFRGSDQTITIDASELVVGDLIKYEQGMKVPADCIMMSGIDTVCIEGELTGEPDGVEKVPLTEDNYNSGAMCTMLAKSLIQNGQGTALVLAVGPNSVAGVITEKTMSDNEPTHLQKKLVTMAEKIGNVGIGCAVLTFFSLIVRVALEMMEFVPCGCMNITSCQVDSECKPLTFEFSLKNRLWMDVLNTIIIAISVIVCAIPEGLPLAVTISLSYSSAEMKRMNNLVRTMESSETMGGANYICSDKTGTLTLNQMTTMACMALGKVHMSPSADQTKKLTTDVKSSTEELSIGASSAWQIITQGILWNSSARIELNDGKDLKQTG